MILQSLYQLYRRLPDIDRPGFAPMGISWVAVIDREGKLTGLQSVRTPGERGNKLFPTQISAPTVGKRTIADKPGFLADKTDYVFGCHPDAANDEKAATKLFNRFELFKGQHLAARSQISHQDFDAVCKFLEQWNPLDPNTIQILMDAVGAGIDAADLFGSNIAFQISGTPGFVHHLPETIDYWKNFSAGNDDGPSGTCLVTGNISTLARLHEPAIKGVIGAQSMGASLVSFNIPAFTSFAREQSYNAPVSVEAAFAYCTTLNWLLSNRRFRIGDATTVFWTAAPTPAEALFPWMISGVSDAEDTATKQRIQSILERISRGTLANDDLGDPNIPYFILGLSPNSSRLSVRFWHTGTLGELTANLKRHLNQLEIVRQWDETNSKNPEPLHPSSYRLLRQTARDADGIPPQLAGSLMRSILLGTRYPDSLINGVMNRIRVVEKKTKGEGALDNVTYFRAAILKAWLIRNHNQRITIMLDETNANPGYLLGRLFAVLEKTQQDALPGINATIRDRFYSSASATPRAVFGRLLRMYPNHLGKAQSEWASKIGMENAIKRKNGREILSQNIIDHLTDFPAHLNLQNQAQFALGYYHQRKAFYPSNPKEPTTATESTDESNS